MWSSWCLTAASSITKFQKRTPLHAAQRWMSAGSKRKMKVHDILFSKSNKIAPVKTKEQSKPPRDMTRKQKEVIDDDMHVFHDPKSGTSMGFANDLMQDGFFKELANGIKDSENSSFKSIFDDEDESDTDPLHFSKDDWDDAFKIHNEMKNTANTATPLPRAKTMYMGREVEIEGLTQAEVDEMMQDMEDEQDEPDSEPDDESLAKLGIKREELDANVAERVEMPSDPVLGQTILPSRITYDTDRPGYRHSTLMSEVPFPLEHSDQPYSLRVCVLGTPNAGKSVFVNSMTRVKVTAVSPKRNTTRRQTIGVATEANTQITLFDTPGINEIHEAKRYQRDLATEAWDAVADADMALVVMDAAKHMAGPELFLLHKCQQVAEMNPNMRWVLVLNKVDLVEPKENLITYLNRSLALKAFDDCFMISAVTSDGVADIENYLFNNAVPREWEHDGESRTDSSDVDHATEIIREVIYNRMNKEIPYAVQQQNVGWAVLRNGDIRIDQRVVVRRQAHKDILVGMNGKTLRSITQTAIMNLETAFGRKVYLYIRVNVNLNQDFEQA